MRKNVIMCLLPWIPIIVLFVVMVGYMLKEYIVERKEWNKGKCRECGTGLEFDSEDTIGGKLYKCPKCKRYVWLSFPIDKC